MMLDGCGMENVMRLAAADLAYSKTSGMLGTGDLSHHTPKFVL